MKHVQLFILLIAIQAVVVSCRSDDPLKKIVIADSPASFNYVVNVGRAASDGAVFHDAGYYMVFDDEVREVNITISNLQCAPGQSPVTVSFSGVPFDYDVSKPGKQRVIECDALVPDGVVPGDVTLTDVTIVYSQSNVFDSHGSDGFYARYTVNGNYRVMVYPYEVFGHGTTRVITDGQTSDLIDYEAVYVTTLAPKDMSASIEISGLPMLGDGVLVRISGLELTLTDAGYDVGYVAGRTSLFVDDGTVAEIGRLTGVADMRDRFELDMDVTLAGKDYRISAFLTPNLVID